jgi:hypothetical protein
MTGVPVYCMIAGATGNRAFLRKYCTHQTSRDVCQLVALWFSLPNDGHVVRAIWQSAPYLAGELCKVQTLRRCNLLSQRIPRGVLIGHPLGCRILLRR